MTDTRFQVFVSSTFTDLREERQQVVSALLQMNCIPAGMELFPAANDEQWEFIKRVIDDCDYYVVIVAGRYGSTTAEGVSFTEREFLYATERGLPVLAFLHGDPESIPVGQSELDPELRERLSQFRDRLCRDRLVKFWKTASELAAQVVLSLNATLKSHPRPGWVRGGGPLPVELLQEINELRQQKEILEAKLSSAQKAILAPIPNLAPVTAEVELKGRFRTKDDGEWKRWSMKGTWKWILAAIGPDLLEWRNERTVKSDLPESLLRLRGTHFWDTEIDPEIFKTIKIQFLALRLIDVQTLNTQAGGIGIFWRATEKGRALLLEERSVKEHASS